MTLWSCGDCVPALTESVRYRRLAADVPRRRRVHELRAGLDVVGRPHADQVGRTDGRVFLEFRQIAFFKTDFIRRCRALEARSRALRARPRGLLAITLNAKDCFWT